MIAQISSIEVEEQISPGANSPCGDGSYPRHSGPKIPMIERPPSTSSSRNYPRANATIHIIAMPRSGNSTTRCPARPCCAWGTGAGEEAVRLKAGSVAMCPPGLAHQLINNGREDFTYLVISNNAPFDTYYYPDSDKVFVSPVLGANKDHPGYFWTKFRSDASASYFDGED